MEWLNYHHLYYFWVTAHEGGLAAAGRKLRLSHSTVKAQVAQLEAHLDTKLFERRGRGLALTEDGRLTLRYADEIFGLGQEFLGALRGQGRFVEHRLRIAATHVVPKLLVREICEPVLASFPDARLGFYEGTLEHLLKGLGTHEFDVLITDSPLAPGSSIKAFNHLVLESSIVWLGDPRYVTSQTKRRFPECLTELPVLLPSRASAMRRTLDDWFERAGIVVSPTYEFDDTALLKVFGEHGHGVFPLPSVIEGVARKQTGSKRLGETDERVSIYAISSERRVRNPMVLALLDRAG